MNPALIGMIAETAINNKKEPMQALQKSELVNSAIFGNSIQNNMNNLDNVMANAQNRRPIQHQAPSPIQFQAPQLMQRQYMPSAFTNNNGRYL